MIVEVRLYAILQQNRFTKKQIDLPAGYQVIDVLHDLEISPNEVGMLVVNQKDATFEQPLHDGDRLSILPLIGGG